MKNLNSKAETGKKEDQPAPDKTEKKKGVYKNFISGVRMINK
jgi:hypothetical protein